MPAIQRLRHLVPFALVFAVALAAQQPAAAPPAGQDPAVTRLVYDLPAYDVGRLLDAQHTALDLLMTDVLSRLRVQLGDKAVVTALGGTQFAVDIRGDAAAVAAIRPRIEIPVLEMRVVAAADFAKNGVTFDLPEERARLEKWLAGGGRELVLADPRAIAQFNADPKKGPLAFEHLRWVPHVIAPTVADATVWDYPYSRMTQSGIAGVQPLADVTVAVFDINADWNNGRVPDARRKEARPRLLEFVAVNWMERCFTGADLDPKGISSGVADGRGVLNYKVLDEKALAYSNWTSEYIRHHVAMIVDGAVVTAPYFVTRIPGNGQIAGSFTPAEVEALAARLRGGSLPIAPVLLRSTPLPSPK